MNTLVFLKKLVICISLILAVMVYCENCISCSWENSKYKSNTAVIVSTDTDEESVLQPQLPEDESIFMDDNDKSHDTEDDSDQETKEKEEENVDEN